MSVNDCDKEITGAELVELAWTVIEELQYILKAQKNSMSLCSF